MIEIPILILLTMVSTILIYYFIALYKMIKHNRKNKKKQKEMKRHLELVRLSSDDKQTLGELYVVEDNKILFTAKSLELPYRDNGKKISCIPEGEYKVVKRKTKDSKYIYEHLHILDVPDRDYILIHAGNYYYHILGCILIGDQFKDINGDGLDDVLNSLNTLKTLLTYIPKEGIDLKIRYRE